MEIIRLFSFLTVIVVSIWQVSLGIPVNETQSLQNLTAQDTFNVTNNSTGDVLVISSYVYEVGILTDDNNTIDSNDTANEQEEIAISLLSPLVDETSINIPNISSIKQAIISGHVSSAKIPLPPLTAFIIAEIPKSDNTTADEVPSLITDTLQDFSSTDNGKVKEALANLPAVLGLQQLSESTENQMINQTSYENKMENAITKKEDERGNENEKAS